MPGLVSDSGDSLVPFSTEPLPPPLYRLRHAPRPPHSRIAISWARGNCLRVSFFTNPSPPGDQSGGKVVEVSVGSGELHDVQRRRIAYGSVSPFALLQSQKNSMAALAGMGVGSSTNVAEWWEHVMAFSDDISSLLGNPKRATRSIIEDEKVVLKGCQEWVCLKVRLAYSLVQGYGDSEKHPKNLTWVSSRERQIFYGVGLISSVRRGVSIPLGVSFESFNNVEVPTCLKAAWELIEIFYAEKQSQAWLPERLVDWLASYDCLLSTTEGTVHSKLVDLQKELATLQVIENDQKYWQGISSALAVGWLDIVVKLLRLHGSYQLDQLGNRETENGLVEAIAVLVSKMPRMRPKLADGTLGECFNTKPEFMKAWERWRGQITKLECSAFWVQCEHNQTREGLRKLLQIMLGNTNSIIDASFNWMELYVSHFLYIKPFTMGLEGMDSLAQKCMQLKPSSHSHELMRLMLGIIGENTEVVLAECSRSFGPWMVAHAIELLTIGSSGAETLLHEEQYNLGGISIEELYRLVYAQVLSSHALTWQASEIAPVYLMSCATQGTRLLEILLYKQPVQQNQILLKTLEICRLYELDSISSDIMKIAGMRQWKHGRKGSGVFWLQKAQDEVRLNRISQQLFDYVGRSISDNGFKQWEGLIELLGQEAKTVSGLDFLHKYRDFKKSLQQITDGKASDAARQAVESLILLMKNPSTPQKFWLPLLHDSVSSL
ncbi:hypothetical protein Syun_026155 [Stephania yunnanensis]|uniref:Nuclear pore complex protein Nup85 n=1 Tax=Stephania yunnanensis TaxID=152371 RepID=A0AAP0EVM3_9MAGN